MRPKDEKVKLQERELERLPATKPDIRSFRGKLKQSEKTRVKAKAGVETQRNPNTTLSN